MQRTYQYCDGEVCRDGLAWALLSGDIQLHWGANHGCTTIGDDFTVTKAAHNRIYEIDGIPVIEFLRDYMIQGDEHSTNHAFLNIAIGFRAPEDIVHAMPDYDFLITHLVLNSENPAKRFITVLPELPEGTKIWLVHRDPDIMSARLKELGAHLATALEGRAPAAVLQFDCAGRGKVTFREHQIAQQQTELQQTLGAPAAWAGFYTYGEIAPIGKFNCFHNYTATLVAISEH